MRRRHLQQSFAAGRHRFVGILRGQQDHADAAGQRCAEQNEGRPLPRFVVMLEQDELEYQPTNAKQEDAEQNGPNELARIG